MFPQHRRDMKEGRQAPAFDKVAYRGRNTVERCINRLKQWRGLAIR
jgi:transposase